MIPPEPRTRQEFLSDLQKDGCVRFKQERDAWKIDFPALRKAITPKTKVLILNNPNNPTGKVFTDDELSEIADIVNRYERIVVISDEVYEKCYFPPTTFVPRFAACKNMWNRTISTALLKKPYFLS